jgi:adenylate kinase family enzyme
MKPLVVAITGNISAGKSTLAKGLQARLNLHFDDVKILSSDTIRNENPGWKGHQVFGEMAQIVDYRNEYVESHEFGIKGATILDSTGMSPRFRALIRRLKSEGLCNLVVIRLRCDTQAWQERDAIRTDRPPLELEFFAKSNAIWTKYDAQCNTTFLTPEIVLDHVWQHLERCRKAWQDSSAA